MRCEIENFVGKSVMVEGRVSAVSRHAVCVENIKVNGEVDVDHSWIQRSSNNIVRNPSRGEHIVGEFVVGVYKKRGGIRDFNFNQGVIV